MNITELNDALIKNRLSIAERDRLQRDLDQVERELSEERTALDRFNQDFDAESQDVRRLEGFSLTGLYYMIIGSREAQLDKERQEMLAAKLKFDNVTRRVETLEGDAEDLRLRLAGLRGLEEHTKQLLEEKERLITQADGPAAAELLTISERYAAALAELRELHEAVQAGHQAQDALHQAIESLESAQGWGTWDMFGGGMLASGVKHQKLDDAKRAIEQAQPLLQRFERELADVGGTHTLNLEIDGLTQFADVFIDMLLVDLLVQSQINESLEAVRGMYEKVAGLTDTIARQEASAQEALRAVETQRLRLLEV